MEHIFAKEVAISQMEKDGKGSCFWKTSSCFISFQFFFIPVLALFSVVSFKNQGCRSNNGNRNGTCYTSSECLNKGGDANGGCAAG